MSMQRSSGRLAGRILILVAVLLVATAAAAFAHGSQEKKSPASSATFGVNATGTVHFWARAATATVATAMVKEFNA